MDSQNKIYQILMDLNRGRVTVSDAYAEIIDSPIVNGWYLFDEMKPQEGCRIEIYYSDGLTQIGTYEKDFCYRSEYVKTGIRPVMWRKYKG